MKKNYDLWANKRNIKNLELYTKLIGIFYFSIGFNFFLVFIYWKFIVEFEIAGVALILSILMFAVTPAAMTDPYKANRDLGATISLGVVHGVCTIGSILVAHFWLLYVAYGIEILVVILLVIKNKRLYKKLHNKNKRLHK